MLAAVGASLESDEPSVVHGAVDQRGGHVLVAEHAPPAGELDVRGVDHAPGLVGIRYDLKQEPGTLLVDRHVATDVFIGDAAGIVVIDDRKSVFFAEHF